MSNETAAAIRALNDLFRVRGPAGGDWLVTPGVIGLGTHSVLSAIAAVSNFDAFDSSNDPYAEHDFGSFEMGLTKLYWKIDYYDPKLEFGSENPADATITRRVMTILLAEEY